jgi:hypothetical protein
MGGLGSGGARSGSGPKPRGKGLVGLTGGKGADTAQAADVAKDENVVCPVALSVKEVAHWDDLARHAVEHGTLVPSTVAAFVLLCKLQVMADEMYATLLEQGFTYLKHTVDGSGKEHEELKAHPLVSQHRNTVQRIESLMVKFKIAPMGKPVEPVRKKKATKNPWADIGRR